MPEVEFDRYHVKIPRGYKVVAWYHTHPTERQGFSSGDATLNNSEHTTDYVADTVGRNLYRYDGNGWTYEKTSGTFVTHIDP
jgi:proteasome lid subunit RPN8/RPN11